MKRLPVIATLLVAAAVATMIMLGFWQIRRAHEKEALIARYAAAEGQPPITWPDKSVEADAYPLFRHAAANCASVKGWRTSPGQNAEDEPGFLVIADCVTAGDGRPPLAVELGWTKNPNGGKDWPGGLVNGMIAPDRVSGMRLHAAAPGPGLMPSAAPSLSSIPNNHRSYAVQWFLFAAIAAVIYVLALKRRRADG